jgi:3-hydroxyisobutyrate dehydrogenase-like beta-hydroxyacid dehydrogenase
VTQAASRQTRVGLIGLGAMGAGMARNLLKGGLDLVVYDIDAAKTEQFASLGATAASGPADVARQARVVITMVDTTAQSEEVIVGPGGIIEGAEAGDAVLCMSTIDPIAVQTMAKALASKEIGMIDSPVTGMIKGANEGTLRAFVGGEASVLETCRPALEAMTSEITHIGALGQGLIMKLINNMLYKINSIAAIEAMVLGVKAGLDPRLIHEVISHSTGNSPAFQYRAQRMIDRNFDGVRLDISYKDLTLEAGLGRAFKVPLFMSATTMQIFEMGRAAGFGSEDATAIVKIYEKITGVTVGGAG